MKNGLLKRTMALLLASMMLVTPVFKPADMSFLSKIRTNSYSAGQYIGRNFKVTVSLPKY